MTSKQNIYLIGPMGAGKSSIGLYLSQKSKMPFYDSDREIEKRSGADIDWIFEIEKEQGYRDREKNVICDLCNKTNIILATGGGSITIPEVCSTLAATGLIIYLVVPFEEQLQRTQRRPAGRPLLAVNNPEKQLKKLNAAREPIYNELADLTYTAAHMPPKQIAQKIWADIKKIR